MSGESRVPCFIGEEEEERRRENREEIERREEKGREKREVEKLSEKERGGAPEGKEGKKRELLTYSKSKGRKKFEATGERITAIVFSK